MTIVPDSKFPSPAVLNKIPCVASDRYLKRVPEKVKILSVCQDDQNTSLVYIEFQLVGVFDFTPSCAIIKVDLDDSFGKRGVMAPIHINYYRNSPKVLPISAACNPKPTYIMAFDFGKVIPNFLGAKLVEFDLIMSGIIPEKIKLPEFRNLRAKISTRKVWTKGPTPNPYSLVYNSQQSKLHVFFQFEGNSPCECNISCQNISGVSPEIKYCPDQTSRIIVDYVSGNDPSDLVISFSDGLGNSSNFTYLPLVGISPTPPTAIARTKPRRVEVGIARTSLGGKNLGANVYYQVWKFDSSLQTSRIWKDWNNRTFSTFTDTDVIPGRTYGYAVRYKGEFGEESPLSAFTSTIV